MTFTITFWEIALLIIAIAFIFLVAAAVRFFNQLKNTLSRTDETLGKVNNLIDNNKSDITKLIGNAKGITSDVQEVTDTLTTVTDAVKKVTKFLNHKK